MGLNTKQWHGRNRRSRGASALSYALAIGLVAVGAILATRTVGTGIRDIFLGSADQMAAALDGTARSASDDATDSNQQGGDGGGGQTDPDPTAPPSLSPVDDVRIASGFDTPDVTVTATDADTPAADLQFSFASSDPGLLDDAAIGISLISGDQFRITLPNLTDDGSAIVTVTVSDGTDSHQTSFTVTAAPPCEPLAEVARATLPEGGIIAMCAFSRDSSVTHAMPGGPQTSFQIADAMAMTSCLSVSDLNGVSFFEAAGAQPRLGALRYEAGPLVATPVAEEVGGTIISRTQCANGGCTDGSNNPGSDADRPLEPGYRPANVRFCELSYDGYALSSADGYQRAYSRTNGSISVRPVLRNLGGVRQTERTEANFVYAYEHLRRHSTSNRPPFLYLAQSQPVHGVILVRYP